MIKSCGSCAIYQPSRYEPKQGAGMCGALVEWYAKHNAAGTKPRPGALDMVYKSLGGKFGTASAICWADSVRDKCTKFVRKAA